MAVDFKFTLFFFGEHIGGGELQKSLERLVAQAGKTCEVEMIDLSLHPEAAAQYHILATPLLVRTHPLPIRRVIGHLTNLARVARALDIDFNE